MQNFEIFKIFLKYRNLRKSHGKIKHFFINIFITVTGNLDEIISDHALLFHTEEKRRKQKQLQLQNTVPKDILTALSAGDDTDNAAITKANHETTKFKKVVQKYNEKVNNENSQHADRIADIEGKIAEILMIFVDLFCRIDF